MSETLFTIKAPVLMTYVSRGSAVGIATAYGLDDRGVSSSHGRVKNFHFSISSRLALWSTQPSIQWIPGELSPRVKRQEREADHTPRTSAEFKKTWIYAPTPPYVFLY
jgi:hypothetical protein